MQIRSLDILRSCCALALLLGVSEGGVATIYADDSLSTLRLSVRGDTDTAIEGVPSATAESDSESSRS